MWVLFLIWVKGLTERVQVCYLALYLSYISKMTWVRGWVHIHEVEYKKSSTSTGNYNTRVPLQVQIPYKSTSTSTQFNKSLISYTSISVVTYSNHRSYECRNAIHQHGPPPGAGGGGGSGDACLPPWQEGRGREWGCLSPFLAKVLKKKRTNHLALSLQVKLTGLVVF